MQFSDTIDFNDGEPAQSTVDVQINVSSIDTNDPNRDKHLKSPDFFSVEKYPFIYYRSKQIDDRHGRILGDLTIRGITREVILNTEFAGIARSP